MATQNPIESDGTYPLPEAQVDRFMMKVLVGYPTPPEAGGRRAGSGAPGPPQVMLTPEDLIRMRESVSQVYVDPAVVEYAVRLVAATRSPGGVGQGDLERYVTYGASPRATIALVLGGRALAFLRSRDYVLPNDVDEVALDVLRHCAVVRGHGRRPRRRHHPHPRPARGSDAGRGAAAMISESAGGTTP